MTKRKDSFNGEYEEGKYYYVSYVYYGGAGLNGPFDTYEEADKAALGSYGDGTYDIVFIPIRPEHLKNNKDKKVGAKIVGSLSGEP